jgi:pimeloyl-ACP methyl ester carboxylesterase
MMKEGGRGAAQAQMSHPDKRYKFGEEQQRMRKDHLFRGPDGDFHYIDWGCSGPLAHFSHATGFCAGLYTPLAERLYPHLRIIGMDDRGHGKTEAPADPGKLKNWDIFAEDLARFFQHLGGPVIAMGHSRGAVASLLVAVRRPELVRALVLIDPTILPYSWMWWWFLAQKTNLAKLVPIAYRAARRRSVWPSREAIFDAYQGKGPFQTWKDGFLEAYVAEGTEETGQGTIKLCCDPAWESRCFAVCPHDIWGQIPKVQQPTLVLYGTESYTFLTPAVRRFKAKVPTATLRPFEQTSHFVPMERPDHTTEAIISFLKENHVI